MTNLQLLRVSRKQPLGGDVFAMMLPDNHYLFGRVISTEATIGPMSDVVLIYIYREQSCLKEVPERLNLGPDRLLVPPILTNRRGWTMGLFETIAHLTLDESDVLRQHCFKSWTGAYSDELSNPLDGPVEPVGHFALQSFRTIDDRISDALGFERAPD